ncbi:MAG: YchJ family metal-binding protein [Galbitalea sp.]
MSNIDASERCPCGTGLTFGECCGPFLATRAQPPTAERMMRSRYTAYAVRAPGYLLATWHPSTRPASLSLDPGIEWIGLEILARSRGGLLDSAGTVEFRARYRANGARDSQHENSRFVRENKTWLYVDDLPLP